MYFLIILLLGVIDLVTATGIIMTLIFGLITGEPLTLSKPLAVFLILIGAVMLGRLG